MNQKQPKYKSKFEGEIAKAYPKLKYETHIFYYKSTYKADWHIKGKKFIETKGYLDPISRTKLIAVKHANPEIKFYILFQNAGVRISKYSNTTYGDWATKHGFTWSCWRTNKEIPKEWLR